MITTKKMFDMMWWDDFLTTSDNMSKAVVFKDCLTKEDTFLMRFTDLHSIVALKAYKQRIYSNCNRFGMMIINKYSIKIKEKSDIY